MSHSGGLKRKKMSKLTITKPNINYTPKKTRFAATKAWKKLKQRAVKTK